MKVFRPTRRQLLAMGLGSVVAAGGLAVGIKLKRRRDRVLGAVVPRDQVFVPGALVSVGVDDRVKIYLTKTELGQGVMTALPLILCDELGADWDRVEVVQDLARSEHGFMLTGVSYSVRGDYDALRQAGAVARELLCQAAATRMGVEVGALSVEKGVIRGPEGQVLRFGEVAADAAELDLPWIGDRPLRPASELSLTGRSPPRLDVPAKTTGEAIYSMDVRVPGMRYAVLARPERFGAEITGHDPEPALALPGVRSVHRLPSGVAVVADSTWAAMQGAEQVQLQTKGGLQLDDAGIERRLTDALETTGLGVVEEGVLSPEAPSVTLELSFPLLPHLTMEPQSCTASFEGDRARVWAPTQAQLDLRRNASGWFGLPEEAIEVHTPFVGGAFGRRVQHDFAEEACLLAKACGEPVKVVFTREQDSRHDWYRPPSRHRLAAWLDDEGRPSGWRHHLACPSIVGRDDPGYAQLDETYVEGSRLPYGISAKQVRAAPVHLGLPIGFWRSVGHSFNAFAVEHFMDVVAKAGGHDPLELRRGLLGDQPRWLAVLERAAEMADWGRRPAEGRARGLAVHACYDSWVAQVVEVSLDASGPRVHEVWAAADVGIAIHPDTVRAQLEGGIVFGLSAVLSGQVSVRDGAIEQSNFHDLPILRYGDCPEVTTDILPSEARPGGVGEIAVPSIGPAVANALLALTGAPTQRLPLLST